MQTIRTWSPYGHLAYNEYSCGINSLVGSYVLSHTGWFVATYTRDAMVVDSTSIANKEWRPYGFFGEGAVNGGINCLDGHGWLDTTWWHIATIAT